MISSAELKRVFAGKQGVEMERNSGRNGAVLRFTTHLVTTLSRCCFRGCSPRPGFLSIVDQLPPTSFFFPPPPWASSPNSTSVLPPSFPPTGMRLQSNYAISSSPSLECSTATPPVHLQHHPALLLTTSTRHQPDQEWEEEEEEVEEDQPRRASRPLAPTVESRQAQHATR